MSQWKQKASSGGGGSYEKAPAGNHPAVLVALIDMGTQEQEFGGEVKEQHRIYGVWELVTEKKADGSNHVVGLDLTLSLNEKAKLRKWIEARLGRLIAEGEEYDVLSELGQPCLLNVVEKNGYPKVEGMSSVPKGMQVAKPTYPLTAWHLDDLEKTGQIALPSWVPYLYGEPLADHIKRAKELVGKSVATGAAPAAPSARPSPPSAAPSAPASRPAPPSRPASPSRYWVDLGGGQLSNEPLPVEEAGNLIFTKGLDPDKVLVCPDGGNDWKPASTFGIKTAF
ncbi:MAG TPA: hypothetical protein VEA69_21005 [Tepidisphaeraceae bacterium]|nr:hypothetical protein [Tepidisphaeraceae bacterium]